MTRTILSILLATFLASSLAACGKKGPPEVPKGQVDTLNRKYPTKE